jgi:beta-glucosidase
VTLTARPRLLARFDGGVGQWRIAEATYKVALGKNAEDVVLTAEVPMA